jgi:hypothetical protein
MFQMQRVILVGVCLLSSFGRSFAQAQAKPEAATPPAAVDSPAAKPADVSSPDAIIAAVYDVISGPAGHKRDWNRMRSLFYPGARLIPVGKKDDGLKVTSYSVQEYIDHASPYFEKNGFSEREIARHGDKWGNLFEAFSTYESRHDAKDAAPFARGINSMQLFFDGTRWWFLTICWEAETPELALAPEFLPHSH